RAVRRRPAHRRRRDGARRASRTPPARAAHRAFGARGLGGPTGGRRRAHHRTQRLHLVFLRPRREPARPVALPRRRGTGLMSAPPSPPPSLPPDGGPTVTFRPSGVLADARPGQSLCEI